MDLKRSWMFVPGNKQRMIDKAMGLPVDAIMLDIEDGVAPNDKPEARRLIAQALQDYAGKKTPARFVRVNAIGHEDIEKDLDAVVVPGLEGIVLPKVERDEMIQKVDELVSKLEKERSLTPGSIKYMVSIESPTGLMNAYKIATSSKRVIGLMFGAEDFGRELGLPTVREKEARELLFPRSSLVISGSAAHVQVVDGVWPDIQDPEGLLKDVQQSRRLGFSGKSLIHPSQIDVINKVFTPSEEDVEFATAVIEAFEQAQQRGDGAIAFRGQLIDKPIVDRARQTLELYQKFKGNQ